MNQHSAEPRWSCLRRYVGLRVNLFQAMHDVRFYMSEDQTVIATRTGEYALTACVAFDRVFSYYYVRDCGWYRSDLKRLADDEVPESIQHDLLTQFRQILG